MASAVLERLRSEALNLTEAERAELAHALLTSLDGAADADAGSAWDRELVRRLAEIESGSVQLIDRDEFQRRMQEGLGHA